MAIVIKGARLIDGTGRVPLPRGAVLIEGQRISAVGPEEQVAVPAGNATVIEAGGRTVLPALMDCQIAIIREPFGMGQREIAASTLRGVANGRRCLEVGVTTVRVRHCVHEGIFVLKEAFASGALEGPRLLVAGRAISATGGHGWQIGLGHREADGADEVRKAAREQFKAGADCIKLEAGGGALPADEGVGDEQMTPEELKAAVEEAHKKGKHAFAHVSGGQSARNCIAAGVDSFTHGLFLEEDIVRDMKERGIFLVPTLGTYQRLLDLAAKGELPAHVYPKAQVAVARHKQSFQMALAAGVKIAVGTDSGPPHSPIGDSLPSELEIMNQYGMAPMDVLLSATSRAAELLRLTEDLGTLAAGKLADILIVEGDPLANISKIRNTWIVLKEGRVVFRRQPGVG